jgi:hypothetical protein
MRYPSPLLMAVEESDATLHVRLAPTRAGEQLGVVNEPEAT